jgi:formate dehydrogenase maturation protein FdhE
MARQSEISPDTLTDDALRRNVRQEEPTWRQSFEALLAQMQANAEQYSSEEIEADITVAAEEVKELRRARCSVG